MSPIGILALLFLAKGFKSSAPPKLGTTMKINDNRGRSVTLRLQQAGAGFAFVVTDPQAKFDRATSFTAHGGTWDYVPALNAFVMRPPGGKAPPIDTTAPKHPS
jgi:hypothetical protein